MNEKEAYRKIMRKKSSKGGKRAWADISAKERSKIIKGRWAVRKLKVKSGTQGDYKIDINKQP